MLLAHVITALSAHRSVCDIDNALTNDNHRSLIKITGVKGATTQAAHAEAISFKIGPRFNNRIGLVENLSTSPCFRVRIIHVASSTLEM